MTRLAPALALAAVALIGSAATASATKGHEKPAVCHPKSGGWVLIRPDQASSHIDEVTGAPKHEHDGRVDVYATNGACPPLTTPTTIPTTPTEVTPSTTTTTSFPAAPTPTQTVTTPTTSTVTSPSVTSQPTSPYPTSSTPTQRPTTPATGPSSGPRTDVPSVRPEKPSRAYVRPSSITAPSPRRSGPSSTVAPPEQLAFTGVSARVLALALALLAAGVLVKLALRGRRH